MKCPHCSKEVESITNFCPFCGKNVNADMATAAPTTHDTGTQRKGQENKSKWKRTRAFGNSVADILRMFVVVIFIAGFIAGIVLGNATGSVIEDFHIRDTSIAISWVTIIVWLITFVVGIMLLGYAEIIRLLNEIAHRAAEDSENRIIGFDKILDGIQNLSGKSE